MKKMLLLLVVVVVVVAAVVLVKNPPSGKQAQLGGKQLIGHPAPDFTLKGNQGDIQLSSHRGKVVILNFWATWCPPCRSEMPAMEALYQKFKGAEFEMLAVNIEADGPEIMPAFLKEHPHSFPILFDTEETVHERYGVHQFPETFVIGKDGVVLDHIIGARDWMDQRMVDYFQKLIEGN